MKLIAKKPCSFGGKKFFIGDEIPPEYVINPKAQEQSGVLTIVSGAADTNVGHTEPVKNVVTVEKAPIVIKTEEGDLPLEVSLKGLNEVFAVLTGTVADAEPIVEQMEDGDALILLHLSDSRKTIREIAEDRAKALNAAQEGAESEGEQ